MDYRENNHECQENRLRKLSNKNWSIGVSTKNRFGGDIERLLEIIGVKVLTQRHQGAKTQ
jgi:hypothetical protein